MNKSQIFLYFCLSFVGGIFLDSSIEISQPLMLGVLILGISSISVFWKYKKMVVIGFCVLFLVAGFWRHQLAILQISDSELQKYNDTEERITLEGIVALDPDIRDSNVKLTISIKQLTVNNNQIEIAEKILITTNRYPEYHYGDRLRITGELKTPQVFEDFNYKEYLAKDGIYSVSYWSEIELIEENQGNLIYSKILVFKDKLRTVIYQNLSPPQSPILGAIILGDKRQISEEWKEKLNRAGVRHLTAVSGMHVAILTTILMSFLIGLGFWRKQAFYFVIVLITLFIILTGLQTSAIRAGIMGGIFLLSQHLGRLNISSRAIVMAAAVMLIYNPLLLKLDVGFQLSFLAMMGIIYLGPVFQNLFKKIPNTLQLRSILAMSFSAQIFTLPILIYNFGYFSLVSPLVNVLIVPLLPLIMGLGFLFVISGAILKPLGWALSFFVWFLLTYLVKVVDWFSGLSFSSYNVEISWVWLSICYIVLGVIVWRLSKRYSEPFFLK